MSIRIKLLFQPACEFASYIYCGKKIFFYNAW